MISACLRYYFVVFQHCTLLGSLQHIFYFGFWETTSCRSWLYTSNFISYKSHHWVSKNYTLGWLTQILFTFSLALLSTNTRFSTSLTPTQSVDASLTSGHYASLLVHSHTLPFISLYSKYLSFLHRSQVNGASLSSLYILTSIPLLVAKRIIFHVSHSTKHIPISLLNFFQNCWNLPQLLVPWFIGNLNEMVSFNAL